ncbi:MAG: HAMP domain-containing sensor histidine kinase [Pseudomonadota bacterium]
MKNLLRALNPAMAPAIWRVEDDELVVVVNPKNKVTACSGALASTALTLRKGQSIFTLMEGAANDTLAAALNAVRRGDSAPSFLMTLNGETEARPVRLQRAQVARGTGSASNHYVRLHLGPPLAATQSLPDPALSPVAGSSSPVQNVGTSDLADLSHEMKTPLNAIMGFADTMREETFGPLGDDRYRDYANDIYHSGQHLMGLITSILDLAREETIGEKTLTLTHVETLLDETMAMVSPALEASGLRLRVECDRDLPDLMLDPQAVRQIVLNLLTNAIKFTSDGEIRVLATLDRQADMLVIIVEDSGIGMSTDQLATLGARFTDLQANGVRGASGHGLGLNLAHRLAEKCAGSLTFSSAPGEGMVARLALPISMPGRVSDSAEVETQTPSSPRNGRPIALVTQMERIERFRDRLQAARKSDAA